MESQTNLENSSRKNDLLNKLRNKDIVKEKFMRLCASWAVETLLEYIPQRDPRMPPAIVKFQNMTLENKKKVNSEFWHISEVYNYIQELGRCRNKNNSDVYWLKEWLRYIPPNDSDTRDKILTKLQEYKIFLQGFEDSKELKEIQQAFSAQETILLDESQ